MPRERVDKFLDFDNRELKRRVMSWVGTLSGIWRVRFEPKRSTRTLRQNCFYWVAIIEPFYQLLREQGVTAVRNRDDAHELLKREVLGHAEAVNPRTGEVYGTVPRSTARLTVEEMSDYIERCRAWIQDKTGIEILEYEPEQASSPRRKEKVPA